MKYAVFAFDQYYPNGGLCDLIAKTETIEEARAAAERPRFERDDGWDFWQIVHMDTWMVMEIGGILASLHSEELMKGMADNRWE